RRDGFIEETGPRIMLPRRHRSYRRAPAFESLDRRDVPAMLTPVLGAFGLGNPLFSTLPPAAFNSFNPIFTTNPSFSFTSLGAPGVQSNLGLLPSGFVDPASNAALGFGRFRADPRSDATLGFNRFNADIATNPTVGFSRFAADNFSNPLLGFSRFRPD